MAEIVLTDAQKERLPAFTGEYAHFLIEEMHRALASKNAERFLKICHNDIEFFDSDPRKVHTGHEALAAELKEMLAETASYAFKILDVAWDFQKNKGAAIIENEITTVSGQGSRNYQIVFFAVKDMLISQYVTTGTVLSLWHVK